MHSVTALRVPAASDEPAENHSAPGSEGRRELTWCWTGLGYLGHWQPILEQLGPEEPWMHEAAKKVFQQWVISSPEGNPERELAARWIACRLLDKKELQPKPKSTLQEIKARLEENIGYHVFCDED